MLAFSPLRPLLLGALLAVCCAPPARADDLTRQVQEELRKRKLYFGDVDGCATEPVAAALRRYQQRKGFPATGQADETTLRSLSLAGPTAADAAAPSPEAAPWPDIAVLRSDQASLTAGADPANPDAADAAHGADLVPTPTPAPPPDAVSVRHPDEAQVRAFLERYLQAGATNDPRAEMRFYGERVDYFHDGVVDGPYIEKDVTRFDRRWPERHFTLAEGLTLALPGPERLVVNCRVRFAEKRPGFNVQGATDNVFTLSGTGPENWRIIGLKEQRVRGK